MSRSTGTFKPYIRLSLDENEWPPDYWEYAYRCINCGTQWPMMHLFDPSPCCNATATKTLSPPDMRWPEAIKELKQSRFEQFYTDWNEGKSDEDLILEELKSNGFYDEKKIAQAVDDFVEDASKDPSPPT
jgi:hypothetical protein